MISYRLFFFFFWLYYELDAEASEGSDKRYSFQSTWAGENGKYVQHLFVFVLLRMNSSISSQKAIILNFWNFWDASFCHMWD